MTAFPLDAFGRYDVANPAAPVPAALLAPDGRYACDACDALTDRAHLVPLASGYFCQDCGA